MQEKQGSPSGSNPPMSTEKFDSSIEKASNLTPTVNADPLTETTQASDPKTVHIAYFPFSATHTIINRKTTLYTVCYIW